MVQYAIRDSSAYDVANEYWKLEDYAPSYTAKQLISMFKMRGWRYTRPRYFDDGEVIRDLASQLSRLDRGMLLYQCCSTDELDGFLRERGLRPELRYSDNSLPAILERADEKMTFRFMDLPTELRVWVYEFYFESFGILETPTQPPITRVSKLVREEALSKFYEHFSKALFVVRIKGVMVGHFARDDVDIMNPTLAPQAKSFWSHLPLEHFRRIRKLRVYDEQYRNSYEHDLSYFIDVGDGKRRPRVRFEPGKLEFVHILCQVEGMDEEEICAMQEKEMQSMINRMATAVDWQGLEKRHLNNIIRMFDEERQGASVRDKPGNGPDAIP